MSSSIVVPPRPQRPVQQVHAQALGLSANPNFPVWMPGLGVQGSGLANASLASKDKGKGKEHDVPTISNVMVAEPSPKVSGWTEFTTTWRTCSVTSCGNVLDDDWPSKRCQPCREAEAAARTKAGARRRVQGAVQGVRCASCCVFNVPVLAGGAASPDCAEPPLCVPCRERRAALVDASFQLPPLAQKPQRTQRQHPPPLEIVMQDAAPRQKRKLSCSTGTNALGRRPPPSAHVSHPAPHPPPPMSTVHPAPGDARPLFPQPPPPHPPQPQGSFAPMPVAPTAHAYSHSRATASSGRPRIPAPAPAPGPILTLADIVQCIHPDHRHILDLVGAPPFPPPPPPPPPPPIVPVFPVAHALPRVSGPSTSVSVAGHGAVPGAQRRGPDVHYSETGVILAATPEDLDMGVGVGAGAGGRARDSTPLNVSPPKVVPRISRLSFGAPPRRPLAVPREGAPAPATPVSSAISDDARQELLRQDAQRTMSTGVTQRVAGSIKRKIAPKPDQPQPPQPAAPTPSTHKPALTTDDAENGPSFLSTVSPAPTPPTTLPSPPRAQGKKRKRAPAPQSRHRVCEAPGCGRVVAPHFQGAWCVECAFARWRGALRARFEGVRAELAGPSRSVQRDVGREERVEGVEREPQSGMGEDALGKEGGESAVGLDGEGRVEAGGAMDVDGPEADAAAVSEPGAGNCLARDPIVDGPEDSTEQTRQPSTSIKSVKLIVSPPRDPDPEKSVDSSDAAPTKPVGTESPRPRPSEATAAKPKIKSVKLHVSTPDTHIAPADTLGTNVPSLLTELSLAADAAEDDDDLMEVDPHPSADVSDGDTTDSEASVPLAILRPSRVPSPIPFSSAGLPPPVRRVRLILGPNPSQPRSSRESSPDVPLQSRTSSRTRRSSSSRLNERWHELGWDTDNSELTPLEDSSDEGESEIDLPESDEEQDAEDAGTRKLSIKIPQRPPPKHRWQCRTLGCANLLTQGTHWKNCDVCRTATHRLRKQERLQMRDNIMGRAIANAVRTAVREEETASRRKRKLPMADDDAQEESGGDLNRLGEMPAYQHFAALLESFCTRFAQFKDVQTRYVQLKALSGTARKAMVFKFGGEYSVIADPSGGSVDTLVGTVIRNVQAALGLLFRPAGFLSGPEDSVVAVLSCEFVAWIPLVGQKQQPAATPQPGTAAQSSDQADSAQEARMEVTMTGELHVCVAWDRRHKFFPGQRIIIRFKLVG